jgi:hypothetical protein
MNLSFGLPSFYDSAPTHASWDHISHKPPVPKSYQFVPLGKSTFRQLAAQSQVELPLTFNCILFLSSAVP